MTDKTGIEWTDATWNPIRGCSRVSDGCRNCYAETQAARIQRCDRGRGTPEGQGSYDGLLARGGQWNGQIRIADHLIDQPLRWQRPRRVFVNSMSDLFHPGVPAAVRDQIFAVMALCPHHTFQVLTKRPERMRNYVAGCFERVLLRMTELVNTGAARSRREQCERHGLPWTKPRSAHDWWPLRNIWLGVSVEDQATAYERIPLLLETPAALRWLSMEPLLGPTTLRWMNGIEDRPDVRCLDWIVVGGESGPGARPMEPDWVREIRDTCQVARIPFFFKQWGGERKKAAGRTLDGREYNEFPAMANAEKIGATETE